ncbi:MAG TPA: TonB C-terminal domain-containing protein [Candidatus Hydrogenedentes bacterium]|nr:TonB C-terminal domain-containing protein [Candidatus Hydrogenedentota bacterium]
MDYRTNNPRRVSRAIAGSAGLHVALLLALAWHMATAPVPPLAYKPPFIVLLNPQPQPQQKSFVETSAPAERPVGKTDRIAERDSNAANPVPGEDTQPGLDASQPSRFDQPGNAPTQAPAPQPESAPQSASLRASLLRQAEEKPPETDPSPAVTPEPPQEDRADSSPVAPLSPAQEPPPTPAQSREKSGVATVGFLGFEAMRDQLAPYLREVRRHVEREWRLLLQTRYLGAGKTEAVLDCVIAPNGQILRIEIIEPGGSVSFAPLCKQAIQQAGPFSAFPFATPDMYRDKNLQIRWTFTFE